MASFVNEGYFYSEMERAIKEHAFTGPGDPERERFAAMERAVDAWARCLLMERYHPAIVRAHFTIWQSYRDEYLEQAKQDGIAPW